MSGVNLEEARRILETLRNENLENATFTDKRNPITKLGIVVYPSEDAKVIQVASTLRSLNHDSKFSHQIISMASPKL